MLCYAPRNDFCVLRVDLACNVLRADFAGISFS